jgi:hypothetical protein
MSAKSLIISSDSHVVEPPQLWSDRMDATHGERIPHLEVGDPLGPHVHGPHDLLRRLRAVPDA